MCGIGGVIKLGGLSEKDVEKLKIMSIKLEQRGTDAFGMLVVKDNETRIIKLPVRAKDFWTQLEFILKDYLVGAKAVFVHTREATIGDPQFNKNNHPFEIENYIMAHNGMVYSFYGYRYYYHYDSYSPRRKVIALDEPETDSYYLLKEIVKKIKDKKLAVSEAIAKTIAEEPCSASIWLYDKTKEVLYLFRKDNPLYYHLSTNALWFASEQKQLPNDLQKEAEPLEPYKVWEININTLDIAIHDFSEWFIEEEYETKKERKKKKKKTNEDPDLFYYYYHDWL